MVELNTLQRAAPILTAVSSSTPVARLLATVLRAAVALMVALIGYGMFRNGGVAPHHRLVHVHS
jgi:hypothetical protein